ncbi:MAG: ABC transporter substrate-binding protein [Candidatus Eisenbacteria bacterium]
MTRRRLLAGRASAAAPRTCSAAAAALVAALVLTIAVPEPAPAARPPRNGQRADSARLDVRSADTLLVGRPSRAKEFETWLKGAELADLVWLLRRPARELGAAEPLLAGAALAQVPADRTALRARLVARLGPDPKARRSSVRGGGSAALPVEFARPRASVFRVGALLPDSGDYADYARAVAIGAEAALLSAPGPGARVFDFDFWATGHESPARVAAALEAASWRNGVLVGELLSVPTLAVATAARLVELPLISPTATDEAIGTVGAGIFQIGPSGWSRGERLARALIDRPGLRVGALTSGAPDRSAFALGFLATAQSLGAVREWQAGYNPGTAFREEVRAILSHKLDVLLWDGEPREAEALLREMSRQKAAVRLCGGEGLAPDRLHSEARLLLEGVRYVAEEWRLPAAEQALLDSAVASRGASPSTPLHVRGWLAGRAIGQAVAGGALCPEELTAALTAMCGPPPWLAEHRFLDAARDGATLPMFVVQRGRSVEVR